MNSRAWETWNIVITMLEVGLHKFAGLKKNPIIRPWEVWNWGQGGERKNQKKTHGPGMVYRTFELLLKETIASPLEPDYPVPEIQFTEGGILKLIYKVEALPENNTLQRTVKEKLRELLNKFYGDVFGSKPK